MTKLTQDQKTELAKNIVEAAYRDYETAGNDILVECYTIEDVLANLGRSKTVEGGLWAVKERLGIAAQHEQREAVRNEIF